MSGIQKAVAGLLGAVAVLAAYFCLWAGGLISDTHTKTEAVYNIVTSRSSAREVQIDAGHQENADNISANTNRLEALENQQ